jgi:hypothetical protein
LRRIWRQHYVDNISPKHLINVKRVAYELRPATIEPSKGSKPSGCSKGRAPNAVQAFQGFQRRRLSRVRNRLNRESDEPYRQVFSLHATW